MDPKAKINLTGSSGLVGKSMARLDAKEKVRGNARYSADFQMPGMVHGKLIRSIFPSARLLSIDASDALAMPGVVAILTAVDVPSNLY